MLVHLCAFTQCVFYCLSLCGTVVWVCLADAFSGLEGVERVWEVHVWVGLVHHLVQRHDGVHHRHAFVVAAGPFGVL